MHENVPVRFGRGRLDSLATKGLAAYLIAMSWLPFLRKQPPLLPQDERYQIAALSSDLPAVWHAPSLWFF